MKTATIIVASFFVGLAVATIAMPMPEWPARWVFFSASRVAVR